MQRGNISAKLVMSDDYIWRTPHVVQSIRQREMRWDEFLRFFVQDVAFGMGEERWVEQLLLEGNVGLGQELAKRLDLDQVLGEKIETEEQEWRQMVEVARNELDEYVRQQDDELREGDKEEYEDLLNMTAEYTNEKAYGDAVTALEQALKALSSLVTRRRAAAAAAFEAANTKVSEARTFFAATKAIKFPNGPEEYHRARQLLLKADESLYRKDYAAATAVAEWVKAMCEGNDYPSQAVDELLAVQVTIEKAIVEPMPEVEHKEILIQPIERPEFELLWSREDDEYLIDNYDVLTNGQLKLRLYHSETEIEQRIQYLGLQHDRETRKRVRWQNPYVAGRPLRTKRSFVGREDVFSFIESSLGQRQEDRNLIVLLGHRRTGKTSILLQLRKNRREILNPRVPVFIDMERLLPFPGGLRNFFWKLACCVQEEVEELEGITLPRPVEDEFQDPSWAFQQFLHKAEDAVEGKGLVLMLDEFQAIDPRMALLDADVYKMLRSVIQHDTGVDFLLSGTMEMERLMRTYQAAMFGSAISMKIDFLTDKSARELITAPVLSHVTYDPDAVDLIVKATASHPYFVQLVCWTLTQYLIDRGKSRVFVHDVERILPKALEQGVHFDEIWATETTELELYIMAVVGELVRARNEWCFVAEIVRRLSMERQMPTNPEDLDEAIKILTNRRIFRRSDDGSAVRFQVNVFGQWVNLNKPFEVVRRDIRAEAAVRNRRIERQSIAH